jgi:hypothetical protein
LSLPSGVKSTILPHLLPNSPELLPLDSEKRPIGALAGPGLPYPKNKVVHRRRKVIGMNIPWRGCRSYAVSNQENGSRDRSARQPGSLFCDSMAREKMLENPIKNFMSAQKK